MRACPVPDTKDGETRLGLSPQVVPPMPVTERVALYENFGNLCTSLTSVKGSQLRVSVLPPHNLRGRPEPFLRSRRLLVRIQSRILGGCCCQRTCARWPRLKSSDVLKRKTITLQGFTAK